MAAGRHNNDDTALQPARTVSNRADIDIIVSRDKNAETCPEFRAATQGIQTDAVPVGRGENSDKDYVSLSLQPLSSDRASSYANLDRAAGQGDDSVFAVIWTPAD